MVFTNAEHCIRWYLSHRLAGHGSMSSLDLDVDEYMLDFDSGVAEEPLPATRFEDHVIAMLDIEKLLSFLPKRDMQVLITFCTLGCVAAANKYANTRRKDMDRSVGRKLSDSQCQRNINTIIQRFEDLLKKHEYMSF